MKSSGIRFRSDRWVALAVQRYGNMIPLGRAHDRCVPILMYHSIALEDECRVGPYYRLATSPSVFRRHMMLLQEMGYSTTDLAGAVKYLDEMDGEAKLMAVITFDDGYRNIHHAAWPVLAECGFRATVFLPTAHIGSSRRPFKGRECLTWNEVRELQNAGTQFGSHTVTHPILHGLPWCDIESELRDSKCALEDVTGTPVTDFAYPYAYPEADLDFCNRLATVLESSGYRHGVTTRIGRMGRENNLFQMPRLPINGADDDQLFRAKMQGAYDWLGRVQYARKRLSHQQRSGGVRSSSLVNPS